MNKNLKQLSRFLVVFLLSTFYFLLSAWITLAATLYLSPVSGNYPIGQNFTIAINVSTPDQAMNAAQGTVTFPSDRLEVVSLSKSGSILNLWVQEPSFSNEAGTVQFEGVVLNPGFTGSAGKLISISFKGKETGEVSLGVTNGSVLANDGIGTNILTKATGADYLLTKELIPAPAPVGLPLKPEVRSETHPQEDKWYNNPILKLNWDLPEGVDKIRFTFDEYSKTIPPTEKGVITEVQYDLIQYKDGVYYFHLRFHNAAGWGPTTHRRVQIDRTPPLLFEIKRFDTDDPTNPQPVLSFSTTDKSSGIDFYLIQIDEGDWFNAEPLKRETVYVLPLLPPGSHNITVRAVDAAGNYIEAKTVIKVEPIPSPRIIKYLSRVYFPKEALLVEGTAIPNAQVILSITKDSEIVSFETTADSQGLWQASYQKRLKSGFWQLSAKARDKRGALSLPTGPVSVRVDNWFNYIIRFIFSHLLLITILLIVIDLLAVGFYLIISRQRFKDLIKMKRPEKDIQKRKIEMFEEKLNKLKEELEEDIIELEKDLNSLRVLKKDIFRNHSDSSEDSH